MDDNLQFSLGERVEKAQSVDESYRKLREEFEKLSQKKQMRNLFDQTIAFINTYAILGALENLCELDERAK